MLTYGFPQNDGSAGLFQPLDDIFDEAMPKIVQVVNKGTSDDASPISQEDMLFLTRCDCIVNALKKICDFQSAPPPAVLSPSVDLSSRARYADITPELTVYRYSEDKVIEYLQAKVTRLSKHAVAEKSRTLIRNLAKDGLMDDGKENLLERECLVGIGIRS
jgi:ribonuclease H2 subunit B